MRYREIRVNGITGDQFEEIAKYLNENSPNTERDYIRYNVLSPEPFELEFTIKDASEFRLSKAERKERGDVISGLIKILSGIIIN
jgi:hypothetical protein